MKNIFYKLVTVVLLIAATHSYADGQSKVIDKPIDPNVIKILSKFSVCAVIYDYQGEHKKMGDFMNKIFKGVEIDALTERQTVNLFMNIHGNYYTKIKGIPSKAVDIYNTALLARMCEPSQKS